MAKKDKIEEIRRYAVTLQASFCAYGTVNGDHHTCDCKFAKNEKLKGIMSEESGCAEARKIIWLCDELLNKPFEY